jgi:hypothetical protein
LHFRGTPSTEQFAIDAALKLQNTPVITTTLMGFSTALRSLAMYSGSNARVAAAAVAGVAAAAAGVAAATVVAAAAGVAAAVVSSAAGVTAAAGEAAAVVCATGIAASGDGDGTAAAPAAAAGLLLLLLLLLLLVLLLAAAAGSYLRRPSTGKLPWLLLVAGGCPAIASCCCALCTTVCSHFTAWSFKCVSSDVTRDKSCSSCCLGRATMGLALQQETQQQASHSTATAVKQDRTVCGNKKPD